ncbi:MAG: competence protein TfoX [Afipia sp. 62-7]|nr:TfoX/Sxy family protein [Afipia sp.]OJU21079.1 MAG: competence protein TfoX [Afipia sp. 62-7]
MDRDHLIDLFSEFGPISLRKMFSGFGISADGVNFAMALRAGLIFRVDELTIPRYDAEGAKPFQYDTRNKTVVVNSYRHLPERLYDDPEELAVWAREAVGAAKRAAARKSARKTAGKRRPAKVTPAGVKPKPAAKKAVIRKKAAAKVSAGKTSKPKRAAK